MVMTEVTIEHFLAVLATVALVWAAVRDVRTNLIPCIAGFGILAIGLGYLLLNTLCLESAFFLAAIWGSRGGVWRLPVLILAFLLLAKGVESTPFVIGILYVMAIFELGWFGGGDSQLAFGLVALGRDWWILAYLFGGTILVGLTEIFLRRGFGGGFKRFWWVLRNLKFAG